LHPPQSFLFLSTGQTCLRDGDAKSVDANVVAADVVAADVVA
jgi:hypothetical protein